MHAAPWCVGQRESAPTGRRRVGRRALGLRYRAAADPATIVAQALSINDGQMVAGLL